MKLSLQLPAFLRKHPIVAVLLLFVLSGVALVVQQNVSYQLQLAQVEVSLQQLTFPPGTPRAEIEASPLLEQGGFTSATWLDDSIGHESIADLAKLDRMRWTPTFGQTLGLDKV